MDQVDAVVVGAGVLGLAVGRALAMRGLETLVLEADGAIGQGISARNSEVIHAGLYYPEGSLKARLCRRGREQLYSYCATRAVAHRRCGKLLVATSDDQLDGLRRLQARAEANGVDDLQWLSATEARALEPALRCAAALLSPSTGIIDSHGLMLALQGDFEHAGGQLALRSRVLAIEADAHRGQVLRVASEGAETMALAARIVVNAAGLGAAALAAQSPSRALAPLPHFSKGSYFSLSGRAPFSRLIYPLPQDAWLGVHLTLDLAGQARFGPDAQWLPEGTQEGEIDYRVDPRRADAFYADVRRYWPALPDGALQPAYSGVRPKIHGPHEAAPDFLIQGPAAHGVPGLVHLLGLESPGLTSCLAVADEVLRTLGLLTSDHC